MRGSLCFLNSYFPGTLILMLCLIQGCTNKNTIDLPDRRVFILEDESGYHLYKDGKPYFIKGACVGDDYWADFKAAGGNTIRIYDTTNIKSKLDRADSLGLMVAVDIPIISYRASNSPYSDNTEVDIMTRRIKRLVSKYKDHPALLFWILGNEIHHPSPLKAKDFFKTFNYWIELIHDLDPNHPVTSSISGMSRLRTMSMVGRSEGLDFLSFNVFGALSTANSRLNFNKTFWDGPFIITEWGINGPWEAEIVTTWNAPIEQTSTKKAEHYAERYQMILNLDKERMLGSFFFYWGQKMERTPTWFSSFLPDGRPTQIVHDIQNFWNTNQKPYPGPRVNYLLLENMGGPENITLDPNTLVTASLFMHEESMNYLNLEWEIWPEQWYERTWNRNSHLRALETKFEIANSNEVRFRTPPKDGPYRLFVYISDSLGNAASTNIPFYVLNPSTIK